MHEADLTPMREAGLSDTDILDVTGYRLLRLRQSRGRGLGVGRSVMWVRRREMRGMTERGEIPPRSNGVVETRRRSL